MFIRLEQKGQYLSLGLETLVEARRRQIGPRGTAGLETEEATAAGTAAPQERSLGRRIIDRLFEGAAARELRQEVEEGRKEVAWMARHPEARPSEPTMGVAARNFCTHFLSQTYEVKVAANKWRMSAQRAAESRDGAAVTSDPTMAAATAAAAAAALAEATKAAAGEVGS